MSTAIDGLSRNRDSSPASVSLSLNLTCFGSVFQANGSNPRDDLRKGFFDVEMRLPGASGAVPDPISDMEDRVDTFLEAENVTYVNLSEYLKALSIFEERKKCEVTLKHRTSLKKVEEQKGEPKVDKITVAAKTPVRAPPAIRATIKTEVKLCGLSCIREMPMDDKTSMGTTIQGQAGPNLQKMTSDMGMNCLSPAVLPDSANKKFSKPRKTFTSIVLPQEKNGSTTMTSTASGASASLKSSNL